MSRYTAPIFYPTAQVLLWLRLDELGDTGPLESRLGGARSGAGSGIEPVDSPPQEPEATDTRSQIQRIAQINGELRAIRRQTGTAEGLASAESFGGSLAVQRLLAERERLYAQIAGTSGESGGSRTAAVDGASPDDRFVRGGILPISVQIERNGFRTADTASVTLAWRDVPFDPRLVRACGIEIVIGATPADQWAQGVRGELTERGVLRSQIEAVPAGAVASSATRFVGFVDEWAVDLSPDGDTVSLECRDNTALLIDTPLASGARLDLSLPLDEGLRRMLAEYPTLAGMRVAWGDVWETDPGDAPVPGDAVPREQRTRRGQRASHARSGDQRMTLWDYVTDICVQVGVIPLIRDYELRLVQPRALFSGPGAGPGGRPRRMVYGRNLADLGFKRKLGGQRVPTVEVRAYDPSIGRTRWARWPVRDGAPRTGIFGVDEPPRATRASDTTASGAAPDDRIQTFTIRYGGNADRLSEVARSLFEQIGRQEIEGTWSTSDVRSWEVEEDTADLLQLVSGDPVEILVAPTGGGARPTTVSDLEAFSVAQRAAFLESQGWSSEVAERFAQLQEATGFQTIFRTKSARVSYDCDEGIDIKADFINFVTVREAPDEQPAAVPSPEVEGAVRGRTDSTAAAARRASRARREMEPDDPAIAAALEEERTRLGDALGRDASDAPILNPRFLGSE